MRMRIGVLASHEGTTLQAIIVGPISAADLRSPPRDRSTRAPPK